MRRKDGSPCYIAIILEFQSRPDPFMALRILVYSGLLLQTLAKTDEVKAHGFPPLLPIVIYNGPAGWNAAEEVADLFAPMDRMLEPFNPRQRYLPIKVMALPEEALAGRGIAAQVFRMERSRDRRELGAAVSEVMRRFQEKKYEDTRRIIIGWLRNVLFERHHITGNFQKMDEWEEVHAMLAQTVDGWVEKGVQAGLAQGLAQGESRMARRMAKDTLIARFGAAPEEVMARLEAIADPEVLRRLAWEATWKVQSLEDFIALLPDGKAD